MEEAKKASLVAGGIDVDGAMGNFMGNEAMFEKYLKKFLAEKSYQNLLAAVEAHDPENARLAAHTLKSVTGTLGCKAMNALMIRQEGLFKSGDWDGGVAMMPDVTAAYEHICAVLQEYFQ